MWKCECLLKEPLRFNAGDAAGLSALSTDAAGQLAAARPGCCAARCPERWSLGQGVCSAPRRCAPPAAGDGGWYGSSCCPERRFQPTPGSQPSDTRAQRPDKPEHQHRRAGQLPLRKSSSSFNITWHDIWRTDAKTIWHMPNPCWHMPNLWHINGHILCHIVALRVAPSVVTDTCPRCGCIM